MNDPFDEWGHQTFFPHFPFFVSCAGRREGQFDSNRVLKNVMSADKTRQNPSKTRSLCVINEHFEEDFNAVSSSAIVFQEPAKVHFSNKSLIRKRSISRSDLKKVFSPISVLVPCFGRGAGPFPRPCGHTSVCLRAVTHNEVSIRRGIPQSGETRFRLDFGPKS
jgi:hypothetical protein